MNESAAKICNESNHTEISFNSKFSSLVITNNV